MLLSLNVDCSISLRLDYTLRSLQFCLVVIQLGLYTYHTGDEVNYVYEQGLRAPAHQNSRYHRPRTHQGIDNLARQRSLMLHYAGTDVQDIHKASRKLQLTTLIRHSPALWMLWILSSSVSQTRHTNAIRFVRGQSVDQFASLLRMQAKHCSFQDGDDQLCDQFIEHIRDARLRRKQLETANIKLCRRFENRTCLEVGRSPSQRHAARDSISLRIERQ